MAVDSVWHVLSISQSNLCTGIIVRHSFTSTGYTIEISDFSRVWSEKLDKLQICRRADQIACCIDPTERSQFEILLQHISDALEGKASAELHLEKKKDELQLQISTPLPEPLPLLRWTCSLTLLDEISVRNHVILPLLASVHVMNCRIDDLSRILTEKDRAIDRMIDKVDSNKLDISSIFPIAAGKHSLNKKELIHKHVQGMRPFEKDVWLAKVQTTSESLPSLVDFLNDGLSQTGSRGVKDLGEKFSSSSWQFGSSKQITPTTRQQVVGEPQISGALGAESSSRSQSVSPRKSRRAEDENMHIKEEEKQALEIALGQSEQDDDGTTDEELGLGSTNSKTNTDRSRHDRPAVEKVSVVEPIKSSPKGNSSTGLKLGTIGGEQMSKRSPSTSQRPMRESKNVKDNSRRTGRRLGEISGGSRSREMTTSHQQFDDAASTVNSDIAPNDIGDARKPHAILTKVQNTAQLEPETKEASAAQTAEPNAEIRREELKRELDEKAKKPTTKRKRRF